MKPKKTSRATVPSITAVTTPPPPTRDQVQALAHAIWMDRGCPHGCDVEIWLEAERQLSGQVIAPADTPAGESVDVDRSDAARIDREMDRIVSPPQQRSPTSL
jgi:hypothetical protein